MINVEIKDRELVISGKSVELPGPVSKSIVLDNLVIVHIDPSVRRSPRQDFSQNVVAVGADGAIIWRIRPSGIMGEWGGEPIEFGYDYVYEDPSSGNIYVTDPLGFRLEIDPETGELSNPVWIK